MKYRKKPVIIDAVQWFKMGDHPEVTDFSDPFLVNSSIHNLGGGGCGNLFAEHGIIHIPEGKLLVCPGDMIITGVKNEVYPCKKDIFDMTYDKVEEE